jgi:glycerol 3-phosphate dehydrogenase (NAD(P)+) (EC 1.1.1.94)
MKNVLAVATGVADGMQLGLNARAGLITRGMNEMLRWAWRSGAAGNADRPVRPGDLVLTCTGDLSRNRRLGPGAGQGVAIDEAVRQIGQVVESVLAADEVARLADQHALDLPISASVRAVLHGEVTPRGPEDADGPRAEARVPARPVRQRLRRRKFARGGTRTPARAC